MGVHGYRKGRSRLFGIGPLFPGQILFKKRGYEIHGISHTGSLCFLLRNQNPCQCKELLFRQNFMRDERSILE